jgi:hypothetical protein
MQISGVDINGIAYCFLGMYSGDYRKSLYLEDGKIIFDDDAYVLSRPTKFRPSATVLRSSQAFQQFIDERLAKLNSGINPSDIYEEALKSAIVNGTVDCKKKMKVCLRDFA